VKKTTKNKKLSSLLPQIEQKIRLLFGNKVIKIILFGSHARGDYNQESDVDILVIVSDANLSKYRKKRIEIITGFLSDHNILLSIRIINETVFSDYKEILPFYKNVINQGVTLYG